MKRILVVDDDYTILVAFRKFLEKDGYEIITERNPRSALEKIGTEKFDLLITDIRMHEMPGANLMVLAKAANPELPIIVITGYPETIRVDELKELGADYIFIKPVELSDIRGAINNLIGGNSQHLSSRTEI